MRQLLLLHNAIAGMDLADRRQAAVVAGDDWRVIARRRVPARVLGELLDWAAAQAAWLPAQHADRDSGLQLAFLDALRGAVAQGEASPAHSAYLKDRVRVHAGQPQLYGTQFTVTRGEFGPFPIEDPQRLDARRAEAGLEPFAAYEARLRAR